LTLNLVYNPIEPRLPPPQTELEQDYRDELGGRFGIVFNHLFTLANMPIQRFGSMLLSTGRFNEYLQLLRDSHQDANLDSVMCRNLISVDWRGYVYDCDFNQMLDLPLLLGEAVDPYAVTGKSHDVQRVHLSDLIGVDLEGNPIAVAGHCYGCTAGQSSCGGALA
jgi:radical SAM/Cys-rich protein